MKTPDTWYAAGIVLFHRPSRCLLLLKRKRDGYWGIPGGKRQRLWEGLYDTAARETFEETGIYVPGPLSLLGENDGFVILFKSVTNKPEPRLSSEHTDFRWASLENLPDPLFPGFFPVLSAIP